MREKFIILISGPISSGKSSLANELGGSLGLKVFKTRELLVELAKSKNVPYRKRTQLQNLANKLDRETGGEWIAKLVLKKIRSVEAGNPASKEDKVSLGVIVEGFRIPEQINRIRERANFKVLHVHITADSNVLRSRFKSRRAQHDAGLSFDDAIGHPNEAKMQDLELAADLVLDSGRTSLEDSCIRVKARIGAYAGPDIRCVDVIVGGQYGSEGKGHIAAYLSQEYQVLVRVGGPNAGHKVARPNDVYTYHHLPSGCRYHPTAEILIGPGAVIHPRKILKEIQECRIASDRISIDPHAMIIRREDITAEKALVGAISSTGQGVGAATARKINGRQTPQTILAKDCRALSKYVRSTHDRLEAAYASGKKILLEGTQGTGLSLHHGHYPYVTSRDTTVAGCLSEAGISPSRVRRILLVVRTYPIRVANPKNGGTSGPLHRDTTFQEISDRSKLPVKEIKKTEKTSTTNRTRRIGEFEWDLFRKSCALNAPTDIVLTFADYLSAANQKANRYEQLTADTVKFVEELERVAHAPVSLINVRFENRSVIDRRSWS